MEEVLIYQGKSFVNFRDYNFEEPGAHGYRWVDSKRFRIPPSSASDKELLAALIDHTQFRDDYASESRLDPTGERHGSYWARHITPATYHRVDKNAAADVIREWARQYGPLPARLEGDLQREVFAPMDGAALYQLEDLDAEFFHDWGGSHEEFHEFVLIDRAAERLLLIVAADD